METIYLGHTFVTLEDCEDAWNESVDGDVTATADTALKVVGAASCKLAVAAGASAGDVLATEARASTDISLCSHVAVWVRSTVALDAGDVQLLLDEHASCASPSETLNIPATAANTWVRHVIVLAGAAADRNAVISVGLKMAVDKGAFDLYVDDIQAFSGKSYTVMGVRGMTDPDEVELNAAEPVKLIDGSYFAYDVASYNRVISVDFGVVSVQADRVFLFTALCKAQQRIIYSGEEVTTVRSGSGFANEWLQGVDFAKAFSMPFREKTARSSNPTSWG
jgi:hypothetical protein